MLDLQRTAGNAAVGNLLGRRGRTRHTDVHDGPATSLFVARMASNAQTTDQGAPEEQSGQEQGNVRPLSKEHARSALSNLPGADPETVNKFKVPCGFSGVYNPASGRFLAYPSGNAQWKTGAIAANTVGRIRGHATVNERFCDTTFDNETDNVGFVAVLTKNGSFSFTWRSRSVNGENPSFEGDLVPEELRQPIVDAFTRAIGPHVRLDP